MNDMIFSVFSVTLWQTLAPITSMAARNPAEFFAVISEYFFMPPNVLHHYCVGVYEQLSADYRHNLVNRYVIVLGLMRYTMV